MNAALFVSNLLLGSTAVQLWLYCLCANAQNQPEIVNDQPYSEEINGQIKTFTQQDDSPTLEAVASAANNVLTFDTTVVKNPFTFKVFDSGAADGDQIKILVNGKVIKSSITLTSTKQDISVNLKPGLNRIAIVALNEGSSSPNTVGIEYSAEQVLQKTIIGKTANLRTGQRFVTTLGFPQIALCQTIFQFPCTTRTYPESAQHVLEAQRIPPEPIAVPLLPGKIGNPLRPVYPRLLTIDRGAAADTRRQASVAPYFCLFPVFEDRDEYPQAVFMENNGSAHIKCINLSDNRGSGSSIGRQLRRYKVSPTSPEVYLDNGSVIEMVILK